MHLPSSLDDLGNAAVYLPPRQQKPRRRLPASGASLPCELGELAQAKVGVAAEIMLQPAEVSGTEDDQHALVARVDELHNVGVDADVAPEPCLIEPQPPEQRFGKSPS